MEDFEYPTEEEKLNYIEWHIKEQGMTFYEAKREVEEYFEEQAKRYRYSVSAQIYAGCSNNPY